MDKEPNDLLIEAASEITNLRRRNEILSAKVEMIDLFACVLHTRPAAHEGGMSPDVVWAINKYVRENS